MKKHEKSTDARSSTFVPKPADETYVEGDLTHVRQVTHVQDSSGTRSQAETESIN